MKEQKEIHIGSLIKEKLDGRAGTFGFRFCPCVAL